MVPVAMLFVFAVGCVYGAAAERKLVYVTVVSNSRAATLRKLCGISLRVDELLLKFRRFLIAIGYL